MMETQLLTEKYSGRLDGMLNCFDRVVMFGSLHPFCYAKGMTNYLYEHNIRIFDYARFAEPLRDEIRANAEALAAEAGLTIEFIRPKNFRKEDRIARLLKTRGPQPGLAHIFSTMEPCGAYQPWHDKQTHHTFLKYTAGKCLHYYFYFEDATLCRLLLRGEFAISGLTNRALRALVPNKNTGQISRLLKRLRVHGVLKKVGRCYKYYLTEFGRQVATMALKLREIVVIPTRYAGIPPTIA